MYSWSSGPISKEMQVGSGTAVVLVKNKYLRGCLKESERLGRLMKA